MDEAIAVELPVTLEALQLLGRQLEAENAAMRPIVRRMAEGRICHDAVTMIEVCPHCSLKRGGEFGYRGTYDAHYVVTLARAPGY